MNLKQYRKEMKALYGEQYTRFLECKVLDLQIAVEDLIEQVYIVLRIPKIIKWLNNKL